MLSNLAVASVESAFFSNDANIILAACVIVLAGVVTFLFVQYRTVIKEKEAILERTLEEAKETRTKIAEQSEKQTDLSTKIYELLLSSKRGQ